jgi:hypothetical protein
MLVVVVVVYIPLSVGLHLFSLDFVDRICFYKAELRVLTKKSVSLKKKKAILQKGGFLRSLLAPIASIVAPLLSTLFQ